MRPLRISHLTLGFTLASSLLVVVFALYLFSELRQTRQHTRMVETTAARQELVESVKGVQTMLLRLAFALADWQETRQQLVSQEYYPLWRDVRLRESGLLPHDAKAVALYDQQGRILDARPPDDGLPSTLPDPIPARPILRLGQRGAEALYFFPIYEDPESTQLLGYGAVRLDLITALRRYRYRYLDAAQLAPVAPAELPLASDTIGEHLRIVPLTNTTLEAVLGQFQSSLLRLGLLVILIVTSAGWAVYMLLARPIRALVGRIDAMKFASAQPVDLDNTVPLPIWELESLLASLNDYHGRLADLHENLRRSNRDFYDQARRDALTGVYNRRAFDEDSHHLGRDQRVKECALLLFDCDHFKAINDTYGHPVGDEVIKAIAACLGHALRADDRLYRMGGDEFAALLSGTDLKVATAIAERCLEQVRIHDFAAHGIAEPVTMSIGLAHESGPVDAATLQKRADLAMYTAKRPGNCKVVVYDVSLGGLSSLVDNRDISAVYQAIQRIDLIALRYQPIVRLPGLEPDYVEALCRIRLDGQIIGPGAIFAIVHARRLDVEFDLAVIAAVRRDLQSGLAALSKGVSINLSAPGVVSDQVLSALLALRAEFPARKIVVEITETALITQIDMATAHIDKLREAGCLVALDDFGSGYSSLRYLTTMPVDMVKFDITLVHLLDQEDLRQRLIVEDMAEIVATAGYELVAEGIETQVLLDKVIQAGFAYGQGFYLDGVQGSEVRG